MRLIHGMERLGKLQVLCIPSINTKRLSLATCVWTQVIAAAVISAPFCYVSALV